MFALSGGVLRAAEPLDSGTRYRVWSYAPDPAPAVLARSRPRYPSAVRRYLDVDGRLVPRFGARGRERFGVRDSRRPLLRAQQVPAALPAGPPRRWVTQARRTRRYWPSSPGSGSAAASSTTNSPHGPRGVPRGRPSSSSSRGHGGLLPALRRGDGPHAADARHPCTGRRRVHERHARRRQVGRGRPGRARLGRGLVRGAGLGDLRSDPGPWDLRRALLVRLRLGRGRRGPQPWRARRGGGQRRPPRRAARRRRSRAPGREEGRPLPTSPRWPSWRSGWA